MSAPPLVPMLDPQEPQTLALWALSAPQIAHFMAQYMDAVRIIDRFARLRQVSLEAGLDGWRAARASKLGFSNPR